MKALGMTGVSKSQISRLCDELDEQVNAFLSRPATGLEFGFRIPAVRERQPMAETVGSRNRLKAELCMATAGPAGRCGGVRAKLTASSGRTGQAVAKANESSTASCSGGAPQFVPALGLPATARADCQAGA